MKQVLAHRLRWHGTLHVVFCVAAWRMDFRLPLGSAVCTSAFRKTNSQQGGQPRGRLSEVFGSSVGRAEVHGQLHASAQHFLDVPMPRYLIRASECDDNVAFHVLDRYLASVYGVVRSEKDQAIEDQELKRKLEVLSAEAGRKRLNRLSDSDYDSKFKAPAILQASSRSSSVCN